MSGPPFDRPAGSRRSRVLLSVDADRFADVVSAVRAAGLTVTQELPGIGVVSGEIAEDRVAALGGIDGVDSVEPERTFQLPPPDSPVQ